MDLMALSLKKAKMSGHSYVDTGLKSPNKKESSQA